MTATDASSMTDTSSEAFWLRYHPLLHFDLGNFTFRRISGLLKGANIAVGGKTDEADKFIEPTVVIDAKPTDPVMQDEVCFP